MGISDNDAKKDGIRVTTEGGEFRKYKAYHIICSNCGCEYVKRQYNIGTKLLNLLNLPIMNRSDHLRG